MKIEVLIDELQEIIDEAFTLPLSGGKTVVNTERIREIIDDMRSNLPIELKQAKSIAADRTNIINKSNAICFFGIVIDDLVHQIRVIGVVVKIQTVDIVLDMVQQSEIVLRAQSKANDIIAQADKQASEIKGAANVYIDGLMKKADEDLSNNLAQLKKTRESLKNYQMSGGSKRPSARQKKNTQ